MLTLTAIIVMGQLLVQTAEISRVHEVFIDPEFARGFQLTPTSESAPREESGTLRTHEGAASEPPAWRLTQWASRHRLKPGICRALSDTERIAETPGKRVVLRREDGGKPSLTLDAKGIAEYAGRLRVAGEPWPHLLLEQQWKSPTRLAGLKRLSFLLDWRIMNCTPDPAAKGKLDPGLHTAQLCAYWTVHNLSQSNPDYQDMIWFGIPLFDARYDVPPPYYAMDSGKDDATGRFICLIDPKRFWTGPTGDGAWRKLDVDLTALLREALSITKEHGCLKHTQYEDLAVTSFSLGWELGGPYDAAVQFRALSMIAEEE